MTADATAAARAACAEAAGPLWRNRDFNLLWSSQTLSELGGQATSLAIPLLVLTLTGSPLDAGAAGTAYAVAQTVMRLPGGAFADRWSRRRVLLLSDAARAALLAVLIISMWCDVASFPLILGVMVGLGAFDAMFSPAEQACLPRLVPEGRLSQAVAQNQARQYGAGLAGPPLGGLLYGLGRAVPFLFDLFTYVVSFVTVAAIRAPLGEPAEGTARATIRAEIGAGLAHVWRTPFLRSLVTVAAPLNFSVAGALFATTVVLRDQGVAAGAIGTAQAIAACGGLLGAFAAPALVRRFSLRQLVVGVHWSLLACLLVSTMLTGQLAMVAPLAVGLFFAPAANASLFGRLAATTPEELQGRVISVVVFATQTLSAVAPFAAGGLIEHADGVVGMLLCAVAALGSSIAATLAPGLRRPVSGRLWR